MFFRRPSSMVYFTPSSRHSIRRSHFRQDAVLFEHGNGSFFRSFAHSLFVATPFFLLGALSIGWAFHFPAVLHASELGLLVLISAYFLARGINKVVKKTAPLTPPPAGSLKDLHSRGYTAFHDIVTPYGSIDHVLIGPHGVFAINATAVKRPLFGTASFSFEDGQLFMNGRTLSPCPLKQAQHLGNWLADAFRQRVCASFPVKTVLAFSELKVISPEKMAYSPVWFLSEDQLVDWVEKNPARLNNDEIHLAKEGLVKIILSQREVP